MKKKIAQKIAARILARFLYFEVKIAPRDYFFRAAIFDVFLQKSRGAKKNRAEKGLTLSGTNACRSTDDLRYRNNKARVRDKTLASQEELVLHELRDDPSPFLSF